VDSNFTVGQAFLYDLDSDAYDVIVMPGEDVASAQSIDDDGIVTIVGDTGSSLLHAQERLPCLAQCDRSGGPPDPGEGHAPDPMPKRLPQGDPLKQVARRPLRAFLAPRQVRNLPLVRAVRADNMVPYKRAP